MRYFLSSYSYSCIKDYRINDKLNPECYKLFKTVLLRTAKFQLLSKRPKLRQIYFTRDVFRKNTLLEIANELDPEYGWTPRFPKKYLYRLYRYNKKFIGGYKHLDRIFIDSNKDKLDWILLSGCQDFTMEEIEKYRDYIKLPQLITHNRNLSDEFLESCLDKVKPKIISGYARLSEEFMSKHFDKLTSVKLARYQVMSEEFIEKHFNSLDMITIVRYKNQLHGNPIHRCLSRQFLLRNIKRLPFETVLSHQPINEEFIETLVDTLIRDDPSAIYKPTQQYMVETVAEHYVRTAIYCAKVSEKFISKYADFINKSTWNQISNRRDLTIPFVLQYKSKLNWMVLSYNVLTKEFLEMFEDCIIWKEALKIQQNYDIVGDRIIYKYINNLDINSLVRYIRLSNECIEKYKHLIEASNITYLSHYEKPPIPEELRKYFTDKIPVRKPSIPVYINKSLPNPDGSLTFVTAINTNFILISDGVRSLRYST